MADNLFGIFKGVAFINSIWSDTAVKEELLGEWEIENKIEHNSLFAIKSSIISLNNSIAKKFAEEASQVVANEDSKPIIDTKPLSSQIASRFFNLQSYIDPNFSNIELGKEDLAYLKEQEKLIQAYVFNIQFKKQLAEKEEKKEAIDPYTAQQIQFDCDHHLLIYGKLIEEPLRNMCRYNEASGCKKLAQFVLNEIVQAIINNHDPDRMLEIAKKVFDEFPLEGNKYIDMVKDAVLGGICNSYANTLKYEKARTLAGRVADSAMRQKTISYICEAISKRIFQKYKRVVDVKYYLNSEAEEFDKTLKLMTDTESKNTILSDFSVKYAKDTVANYKAAVETAEKISDIPMQESCIEAISSAALFRHDIQMAADIIGRIKTDEKRNGLLQTLPTRYLNEQEDLDDAYDKVSGQAMRSDKLENAFMIASMITDEKRKDDRLYLIARNYHEKFAYFIRNGDDKMAQALVEKLPSPQIEQYFKEIIAKTGHRPKNSKAEVEALDNHHAAQPDINQVPSVIPVSTQEVDKTLNLMTDTKSQNAVLIDFSMKYAKDTVANYKAAVETAEKISDIPMQESCIEAISRIALFRHDIQMAADIISHIKTDEKRDRLLQTLPAKYLYEQEDLDDAYDKVSGQAMRSDKLENAFMIASMITDEKRKDDRLYLIARNYHEKFAYFIRNGDDKMAQALVEKLPSPQIEQYFNEIIAKTGYRPKNSKADVAAFDNQSPSAIPLGTQEQDNNKYKISNYKVSNHNISNTQKMPAKTPTRVMPTDEEISKFETCLQTYHEAVKENAWEDIEEATKILTEKHETLLKDRQLYDEVTQKRAEAIKYIANDDNDGDSTADLDN